MVAELGTRYQRLGVRKIGSKKVKREAIALLIAENGRCHLREMVIEQSSIDYALEKAKTYSEKSKDRSLAVSQKQAQEEVSEADL